VGDVPVVTRKFVIEVEIPEDKDLTEMADELFEFIISEGEDKDHPFPPTIFAVVTVDPVLYER
jgi:hypothetical protein